MNSHLRTVDPATSALLEERVVTADGVTLSVRHDHRNASGGTDPGDRSVVLPDSRETGIVVVHGFTGSWRRPEVRAVVTGLTPTAGVVSFDLRGHGTSGGCSTVGDVEWRDLDAVVTRARELGYRRVVTLGWSLGAAVVLRQAALAGPGGPTAPDGVMAVSGPSRWNYRGTPAMRTLHRGIGTRAGRWVLSRFYGTRVCPDGWGGVWPIPPDLAAVRLRGRPVLVVHGEDDHYFPLDHARWLAAAARCELWEVPRMRHAEGAATPELIERLASWAAAVPDRPA